VLRAALEGRQVTATLLAGGASRAVTRFLDAGLSAHDLASVLSLVVSQRMLDRLCEHCSTETTHAREELLSAQFSPADLESVRTRVAAGCAACDWSGVSGRIAVFETSIVDDAMRAAIRAGASEEAIYRISVASGMRPLRMSALELVRRGDVSLARAVETTEPVPSSLLAEVSARETGARGRRAALCTGWTAEGLSATGGEDALADALRLIDAISLGECPETRSVALVPRPPEGGRRRTWSV
jgi:hypothetical protein